MTTLVVAFLLVFGIIGVTEVFDRTNFAVIGLAAKTRPFPVWAGAASAFVLTSALAVAIGTILIAALQGRIVYLRLGGGVFLLAYAAYLALVPEHERRLPAGKTTFTTAFLLVGALEIGDTTMIFIINFLLVVPSPALVFSAAASALVLVAASGAWIGSKLGTLVEPKKLERIIIIVLAAVGVGTIIYALFPGIFPSLF